MKYANKSIVIVTLYTLILLIICVGAISILRYGESIQDAVIDSIVNTDINTEVVYVPIYIESTQSSSEVLSTESVAASWVVRSYEGKIGIFSAEGNLVRIVEVYVKTLPTTDRRLLEEGIVVASEVELRSIIEDYT